MPKTFQMVALKDFAYGGGMITSGQRFTAESPVMAAALSYQRKARFATDKDPEPDPPKRRYRRRDLQAEP